uniref:Uncharacterized protein LOC104215464 isoform X2 n=1 Tax=Nicotiana sylvestris TaxID=4096 RepID=A0A1U7VMI7_NICSY|nr:PREDICTED: uncharacterized protein LOC104215464 isoform X2 [Nicotiana sylvestris]
MRRKLETRNSVCLQNQKSTMTSSDRNGYYLKWREFCLEKIHNFPAAITFYHLQPKSISRRIRRLNLATFGGSPYQLVIVVMQMIKAHKFQGILCVILGMLQSSGLIRIFLKLLILSPDWQV